MTDRTNNILSALPQLTPEERLRLDDLAVAAILDEDRERRRAANPAAYETVDEQTRACVRAMLGEEGDPIPPEAEAGIRRAMAECALSVLEERSREDV